MKKIYLFLAVASFAYNVNAQLSVYSNGHVGVATESSTTPVSTFAVGRGVDGFEAAISGNQRGIFIESIGKFLNWSYGVYGKSICTSASFQVGTLGHVSIKTPQSSGRAYGVQGVAGNATNGWNFGIFGQLDGTNNGAGVYGTATTGENGSYIDGRYAGYFNGATKVNGNLTVTGSINGVILSQANNSAASAMSLTGEYEKASISDKLAALSSTRYYIDAPTEMSKAMKNAADTAIVATPMSKTQTLATERVHYGLDIDQLKESFPELVYELEDGTVGINYVEMIPILVQAINSLRTEIKVLKAGGAYPNTESSSNTTILNLSTDGRVIGTKRVNSK